MNINNNFNSIKINYNLIPNIKQNHLIFKMYFWITFVDYKFNIDLYFVLNYESQYKKTMVVVVVSGVNTDSNLKLYMGLNLYCWVL